MSDARPTEPTTKAILGASLLFAASQAAGHHSAAIFDTTREVELAGVVTKVEWANPHVYIYLDAGNGSGEWEIEGYPPSIMRRLGWSADTLQSGERVTFTVHPHRASATREGFYLLLRKADGTSLAGTRDDVGRALASRGSAPAARATSLAGTWIPLLNRETDPYRALAGLKDRNLWALTPAADAAVQSFREETDHPGIDCIPFVAPQAMSFGDIKSMELRGSEIVIRSEFDGERIVHLDRDSHDGAPLSVQGHSIGRWDGGALVVDTRRFAEHRNGLNWSLPSSAEKHLTERFELAPNGESLTYSFELEDPQYLTRPVKGHLEWAYRPDLTYSALPCDPENARRFIEE